MEEADDSSRSYEAGIFARLRLVKAAVDPFNLFRDLDYVHRQECASTATDFCTSSK